MEKGTANGDTPRHFLGSVVNVFGSIFVFLIAPRRRLRILRPQVNARLHSPPRARQISGGLGHYTAFISIENKRKRHEYCKYLEEVPRATKCALLRGDSDSDARIRGEIYLGSMKHFKYMNGRRREC